MMLWTIAAIILPQNRHGVSAFASRFGQSFSFANVRQRRTFSSLLFSTARGGDISATTTETSSSPSPPSNPTFASLVKQASNIFDSTSLSQKVFAGIPYWDMTNEQEFRVFFVLGGPGAGKGTQCERLVERYPCLHFSVGELLRTVPQDSPYFTQIQETLVAGNIVPVEISLSLLKAAMEQSKGKSLFYLVDGFPRNDDNLDGWCNKMEGTASVYGVFMFACPFAELEKRILERGETSGRSDDNVASAKRRFATFERETVPVVNVLRKVQSNSSNPKLSLRVMDIRGDQTLEQVWDDTSCLMNQYILHDVVTANAQLIHAVETGNGDLYKSLIMWQDKDVDEKENAVEFMTRHEGTVGSKVKVSNGLVDFVEGRKVVVSYDRVFDDDETMRETRVWSHEGERGWVNIHFSRVPL